MRRLWVIGAVALLAGLADYLWVRSPIHLAIWPEGLPAPAARLTLPAVVAGSLPSFAHTLAFALLTTAAIGSRRYLPAAATGWMLANAAFEILQRQGLAGTFDPNDLAGIALGGAAAYGLGLAADRAAGRTACNA